MFFLVLTFAGSRGSCLNTRSLARVFKHQSRDPTSINVRKSHDLNKDFAASNSFAKRIPMQECSIMLHFILVFTICNSTLAMGFPEYIGLIRRWVGH